MPDGEQRVLAEMDRIFPGVRDLTGERVCSDWTNDPYSLGAYATFGPGQLLQAWTTLRQRHGRLVLAGEHTDAWAGYMEGALRSGARAAATVVASG
jgi:monoamine oxidase